jgi:putative iron-dependent peroxidase
MFVGDPPGNHDRILDVSTATTGCLFFVPTSDFLDELPPAPGSPDAVEVTAPPPADPVVGDGSLGIGGLRASG